MCASTQAVPHRIWGAAAGPATRRFGSSLSREKSKHEGQGRAVSTEKAGGHVRPTVSALSLVTLQRSEATSHH